MKKTISILIASIMLVMSVFSVNAVSVGTETDAEPSTPKTPELIYEMINSDGYSVTVKNVKGAFTEFDDMPYNLKVNKMTYYYSVDAQTVDYSLGVFDVRTIFTKDSTIGYTPSMPFWYVQIDESSYYNPTIFAGIIILNIGGFNLFESKTLTSYEEAYEGKTYYVEEYVANSGISKFYYSGDELRYVKSIKDSSEQICSIDVDFEVDEDVFQLPKFAFIDLTFLYKIFSVF